MRFFVKYKNMLINSMILVCYSINIFSYYPTTGYNAGGGKNFIYGSAIGWKAAQINNRFINVSSSTVKTRKIPLSTEFKEEFLSTDKMMQKIKKINKDGITEATLDVTALEENIIIDLNQKEYELGVARDRCSLKRMGCKVLAGIGVIGAAGCMAIANGSPGSKRVLLQNAAIVYGAVSVVIGLGLSYMIEDEATFEKHIEQVQTMRKDWKAFFEVP